MQKEIIMLEFRKAQFSDIKEIVKLEEDNFLSERYTEKMISDIMNSNFDNIFVAEDVNKVLGYIIFRMQDDYIDIFKICVGKSYRNRKIGSKLIEFLENLNSDKKRLILEVRSDNNVAISFYENNYFKRVYVKKNYYENPICDAYIYEKIIEDTDD